MHYDALKMYLNRNDINFYDIIAYHPNIDDLEGYALYSKVSDSANYIAVYYLGAMIDRMCWRMSYRWIRVGILTILIRTKREIYGSRIVKIQLTQYFENIMQENTNEDTYPRKYTVRP